MQKQKGFSHWFIIIAIVVVAVSGSLTFAFLKSVSKKEAVETATTSDQATEEAFKTYTTASGSGLTFTYPSSWTFNPDTEPNDTRSDMTFNTYVLFSQPYNGTGPEAKIASDNVCISFLELKGNFPFNATVPENFLSIGELNFGESKVSVHARGGDEGSAEMKLVGLDPVGAHGASYLPLKEDYFLLAASQDGCALSDDATQRDITKDTAEAKAILESVRIEE